MERLFSLFVPNNFYFYPQKKKSFELANVILPQQSQVSGGWKFYSQKRNRVLIVHENMFALYLTRLRLFAFTALLKICFHIL